MYYAFNTKTKFPGLKTIRNTSSKGLVSPHNFCFFVITELHEDKLFDSTIKAAIAVRTLEPPVLFYRCCHRPFSGISMGPSHPSTQHVSGEIPLLRFWLLWFYQLA